MSENNSKIFLQDQVIYWIKENGKLKKWVAAQIGVSASTFSGWLGGTATIPLVKINLLRELISKN